MATLQNCYTDHLFLLIGGNTLPNYVAARLFAGNIPPNKDTKPYLYLVYSDRTKEQRAALSKTLNPESEAAGYHIVDILVQEANPANIYNEIKKGLQNVPATDTVGLHYTGGNKPMAVHAYRAIQDWQKEKSSTRRTCYTYLNAQTLDVWVERSDWKGAQSLFVGDKLQVSFQDLLALHKRDELKKPMRTKAIWPDVAQGLGYIYSDKKLRQRWVDWWQLYRKQSQDEKKSLQFILQDVTTTAFPQEACFETHIYQPLQSEIKQSFPITFSTLVSRSPFSTSKQPYDTFAAWFTGGWLEDYTYKQLEYLVSPYAFHELGLNINPVIGKSDFEFDVAGMYGYQLFAFSCGVTDKRKECKQKLLEAVARARQLGGAEACIALVCCIEDALDLENEVEMLVRDKQLKVFGRTDLLDLQVKVEKWLKDLKCISSQL